MNVEKVGEVFHAAHESLVCLDWTARDATHNCMPDCESILAVTTSWLIFVYGFCLCGIRRWISGMVVFRNEGTFEPTTEMLIREKKSNPLTWEVMWVYPTRQCFLRLCHKTHLYLTIWCSSDGKTHWNWTSIETCSLPWMYAL